MSYDVILYDTQRSYTEAISNLIPIKILGVGELNYVSRGTFMAVQMDLMFTNSQEIMDGGPRKGQESSGHRSGINEGPEPRSLRTKHQLTRSHCQLVDKMIRKLIHRVFKRSKVSCFPENLDFYKKYLFKKLWPEAKRLRRHINKENFKGLHKRIHKDMRQIFQFNLGVGISDMEKTMFEDLLIRLFKLHLSKKPIVYTEVEDCSDTDSLYLQKMTVPERTEQKKVSFTDFRDTFSDEEFNKKPFGLTAADTQFWSVGIQSALQSRGRQEKCNMLINQFLTELIPLMFEKAYVECSKANFDHLFNRLYNKLWDLCGTADFRLTKENVKNLAKETYKNLLNYSQNKDCLALMTLDLYEPPSDIIVAKTFEKHMLKEKSMVSKFFTSLSKVFTRSGSK